MQAVRQSVATYMWRVASISNKRSYEHLCDAHYELFEV